jgi:hypothetical protein
VEAILSVLAPLLGVVLGAALTSTGARRSTIKASFDEARIAATYAHAAHLIYINDPLGGIGSVDLSEHLMLAVATERNAALISARRAISKLSLYCRDFEPYATDIANIRNDDFLTGLLDLIDREQRRALKRLSWLPSVRIRRGQVDNSR